MLACRKCRCRLSDGIAQQSLSEIEDALMPAKSSIDAHRRAMLYGPLCDPCLSQWQATFQAREASKNVVVDTRSAAIRRLDEACSKLPRQAD